MGTGAAGAPAARPGRVSGPGAPCKRAAWGEQEGGRHSAAHSPGQGGLQRGADPREIRPAWGTPHPAGCPGWPHPAEGVRGQRWVGAAGRPSSPLGSGCSQKGAGSAGSSCPPQSSPLPRGTPAPAPGALLHLLPCAPRDWGGGIQSTVVPAAPSPAARCPPPAVQPDPDPSPVPTPGPRELRGAGRRPSGSSYLQPHTYPRHATRAGGEVPPAARLRPQAPSLQTSSTGMSARRLPAPLVPSHRAPWGHGSPRPTTATPCRGHCTT